MGSVNWYFAGFSLLGDPDKKIRRFRSESPGIREGIEAILVPILLLAAFSLAYLWAMIEFQLVPEVPDRNIVDYAWVVLGYMTAFFVLSIILLLLLALMLSWVSGLLKGRGNFRDAFGSFSIFGSHYLAILLLGLILSPFYLLSAMSVRFVDVGGELVFFLVILLVCRSTALFFKWISDLEGLNIYSGILAVSASLGLTALVSWWALAFFGLAYGIFAGTVGLNEIISMIAKETAKSVLFIIDSAALCLFFTIILSLIFLVYVRIVRFIEIRQKVTTSRAGLLLGFVICGLFVLSWLRSLLYGFAH